MFTDDPISSENFFENEDFLDANPPIYSLESDNNKFLCIICNKPTLLCCSECQQVFYCSLAHQKLHWKFHQQECSSQKPIFPHTASLMTHIKPEKPAKRSFDDKEKLMNSSQLKVEDLRIEKLVEERDKERRDIVIMFSQNQYSQAIIKCRRLAAISKKIFEEKTSNNKKNDIRDFLEFCCDHFLLIKSLLKTDKIQQCRENLLLILPIVNANIDDSKLDYQKLKETDKLSENLQSISKEYKFREGLIDNITFQKRFLINNELKKRTNLLSILASLFYSVGDYKNCELIYVKYIRLVENNFGSNTLEISNCYFLIGVFYLQHKYHSKSLACFKKSLEVRLSKLGEKHESVSDCWYNMGVVYKQTNKKFKAIQYLEKAMILRKELIGEISLPCAQVLEILGKIHLEGMDYKSSLVKFQDCYNIRKKILNNSRHPDLIRVSLLIVHLQSTIKEDLMINNNKKTQDILMSVNEQISNSRIIENPDMGKNTEKMGNSSHFSQDFDKYNSKENPVMNKESGFSKAESPFLNANTNKPNSSSGLLKKSPIFSKKDTEELDFTEENVSRKPVKPMNSKPTVKVLESKPIMNQNANNPSFELNIDKEFMASLATDQLMKLAALKSLLKEQYKNIDFFNPNEIIMNSEFIKGLNGLQYSAFVNGVKPGIEGFNANMKAFKENEGEYAKKEEKNSGFGGLTRGKEDIGGFLKLTDLKKNFM